MEKIHGTLSMGVSRNANLTPGVAAFNSKASVFDLDVQEGSGAAGWRDDFQNLAHQRGDSLTRSSGDAISERG